MFLEVQVARFWGRGMFGGYWQLVSGVLCSVFPGLSSAFNRSSSQRVPWDLRSIGGGRGILQYVP